VSDAPASVIIFPPSTVAAVIVPGTGGVMSTVNVAVADFILDRFVVPIARAVTSGTPDVTGADT
jgi:hypothetical protein